MNSIALGFGVLGMLSLAFIVVYVASVHILPEAVILDAHTVLVDDSLLVKTCVPPQPTPGKAMVYWDTQRQHPRILFRNDPAVKASVLSFAMCVLATYLMSHQ